MIESSNKNQQFRLVQAIGEWIGALKGEYY